LQTQSDTDAGGRDRRLSLMLRGTYGRLAPQHSRRRRLLQWAVRALRRVITPVAQPDAYAEWIAQNEPRAEALRQQRLESANLPLRPLISILTPTHNTPPRMLDAMIRSVVGQSYEHWQLCLADGNSTNEGTRAVLREWARKDRRITVTYLERNQGISGNSNAARRLAAGEFIALLDHDDLLPPFALYEVVRLLNERPGTDVIYSDNDLISEDGARRFAPFFKPDWSPEIMLAANYLCHLCVIRKSVADAAGEFDAALDGAQDWDLFLRVTERTDRVAHIPKVLYHWRRWSNSSALDISAKPYAIAAQERAVRGHMRRRGLAAKVGVSPRGFIRATWPLTGKTKVSIVLLAGEDPAETAAGLESLLRSTTYRNFELLLVQPEGAMPVPISYLQEIAPEIPSRAITYQARNFPPAAYNRAASAAAGDLLLFLEVTAEATHGDWLEEMVRWAELPGVGVVGPKLVGEGGNIKHAGVAIGPDGLPIYPLSNLPEGDYGVFGSTEWYRNWSAVAGDCLLIRKSLFQQLGGFDENAAHGDLGLCLEARAAGYRVVYTPYARLKHRGKLRRHFTHEAQPPPRAPICASEARDPFYNPNLSPEATISQIRIVPADLPDHAKRARAIHQD